MRSHTFHWETKTVITQFADALNDIIVRRHNQNRLPVDQIHVNFVYSPKTRTLHELTNLAQHIKLPIICIMPTTIRRAPERVVNKIEGTYWKETLSYNNSAWIHLLQPVPVDIAVNVSIITRFQEDLDQILTNFIPYTDPYFVVSWKWPDVIPWADFEIRSHVKWSEHVAFQYPVDIPATAPYRCIADTSFIIESWMFKNSPDPTGPIYIIDHSFTAVSAMDTYDLMKSWEDVYNTDYSANYTVISARPQLMLCQPFIVYTDDRRDFTANGHMLDYTDRFFISANSFSMFSTAPGTYLSGGWSYYYPHSGHPRLSALFPGFTAVEVVPGGWAMGNQNTLYFTVTPQQTGWFDIIALNDAGYGQLTTDCIRPTLNPYSAGSPEYLTYVEYQYPCISGIEVRSV